MSERQVLLVSREKATETTKRLKLLAETKQLIVRLLERR
jgi:hypothetical protein